MPQVRCPNCGLTINLENRKQLDINLITDAVNRRGKSFTDLLHVTKLPRKTLSLRLKELCITGILTKSDGVYELSGGYEKKGGSIGNLKTIPGILSDRRVKAFFAIALLVIGFPVASHVLAGLFAPPTSNITERSLQGQFSMTLEVSEVEDLYAWQAVVAFDASAIEVIEVSSGEFFDEAAYPYFVNLLEVDQGILKVGSSLHGNVPGKSGSGQLATIMFGYYTSSYTMPELVMVGGGFETLLLDSSQQPIPFGSPATLSLIG